jgi:hypothetical protein
MNCAEYPGLINKYHCYAKEFLIDGENFCFGYMAALFVTVTSKQLSIASTAQFM